MAFFNVEDFLKAAAGVAQGELLGKQQAQAEAFQRQQQEVGNALQLQQLGAAQDEASFGRQDRLDQQYLQTVFPKVDAGSQKLFLQTWSSNQAKRNEDRARTMAARSGLVPPHLRPYFSLPQSQPMGSASAATPAATPAAAPAPAGTTTELPGGASSRTVNLPGYPPLTLRGITPDQIKQFHADRQRTAQSLLRFRGDALLKQHLSFQLSQLTHDPQDEDELNAGNALLNSIEGQTVGNQGLGADEQAVERGLKRVRSLMEEIRKPGTSPQQGALHLRGAIGFSRDLAKRFPELYDEKSEGPLVGYENQLAALEKEPDPAKKLKGLQDIARDLRDNLPPGAISREAVGIQQTLSHMSFKDQQNPKLVEKNLRIKGYTRAADEVAKNGVPPPDPYHAQKALEDWYGKAPQWADKDVASQNAFLAQGRALAEAAGLTEAEIKTRIPAALGKKPSELTKYQQQTLDLRREAMGNAYDRQTETIRHNQAMEAKTAGAQGSTHMTALLRSKQYEINDIIKRMNAIRTQNALTDEEVAEGTAEGAKAVQNLEKELHVKRQEYQTIYRNLTGVNPRTGIRFAPPPSAAAVPAPSSPARSARSPRPAGPDYSKVDTATLQERKRRLLQQHPELAGGR